MTARSKPAAGSRFAAGTPAFRFLAELAARSGRISYSDFAFEMKLGSARGLSWLLTPMLDWCRANRLPPLPIIVVRKTDGLPSGGYEPAEIEAETSRVHSCDWSTVAPPSAADLLRFALPPSTLRPRKA